MKHTNSESRLEDLLFAFRRKMVDMLKQEGVKYELTFSQVEIMRFIAEHHAVTMRMIADHLKITPPSATALVDELEKKDLVKRDGKTGDRRVVSVEFTGKAKKLFDKLSKRKHTILHSMLAKLTLAERNALERIINILISE
jgi:DNA-binding MarR family transcriptional regulator